VNEPTLCKTEKISTSSTPQQFFEACFFYISSINKYYLPAPHQLKQPALDLKLFTRISKSFLNLFLRFLSFILFLKKKKKKKRKETRQPHKNRHQGKIPKKIKTTYHLVGLFVLT
jgi:hypothetical protein